MDVNIFKKQIQLIKWSTVLTFIAYIIVPGEIIGILTFFPWGDINFDESFIGFYLLWGLSYVDLGFNNSSYFFSIDSFSFLLGISILILGILTLTNSYFIKSEKNFESIIYKIIDFGIIKIVISMVNIIVSIAFFFGIINTIDIESETVILIPLASIIFLILGVLELGEGLILRKKSRYQVNKINV